jgi:hypothetical protein
MLDNGYFVRLEAYQEGLKEWARMNGVPCVDIEETFSKSSHTILELMDDFSHPNETGHAHIAVAIFRLFQKRLL